MRFPRFVDAINNLQVCQLLINYLNFWEGCWNLTVHGPFVFFFSFLEEEIFLT